MSETLLKEESGFQQFELSEPVQRGVAALGFVEPRPIQAATIPAGLEGRDVLGLAETGTGKTAAFALPILERLSAQRRPGPRALILAPTRELAMQIHAEIEQLAQFAKIKAVTVFGGVPSGPQIRALRKAPNVIVACPGRLLDLHGQGEVELRGVETLVIDEADHMFDLGFLPDIRRIIALLPAKRQNLMFSATMPRELRKLADTVLVEPFVVELNRVGPASTIEHALYPVTATQKIPLLQHTLAQDDFTSAIVFCRTKHRAKRLADQLSRVGHRAVALQGNMSQVQRDRAMGGFREGKYDVLVATDIAARGIDVANVSHVINFDVPTNPDAYTHRIGRTGRAERSGKAFTFFSGVELADVHAIERRLKAKITRLKTPALSEMNIPIKQPEPKETRLVDRKGPRPASQAEESRQGEGSVRRRRRRAPQGSSGGGSARPRAARPSVARPAAAASNGSASNGAGSSAARGSAAGESGGTVRRRRRRKSNAKSTANVGE